MNIDNRPRRNLINALFVIGQPLILNVLSVPASIYIIHQMNPLGFGQWSIGVSLIATLSFLTNLGQRYLFVRSVAQNPEGAADAMAEQVGLRLSLSVASGGLALLMGVLFRYPPIVLSCIAVSALGFVFTTFGAIASDLLQGFQRMKRYAFVNFIAGFVMTLCTVVVAGSNAGPIGLSAAYLSGPLLSGLLFYRTIQKEFFPIRVKGSLSRYRSLLWEGRMLALSQGFYSVQQRLEMLLMPQLIGIQQLGIYSAGMMFADRLSMIPDGLSTAFYPAIVRSSQEGEEATNHQITYQMVISLVVCAPLVLLVSYFATPLGSLLMPKHNEQCAFAIQVTIWYIPAMATSYAMGCALQALGKYSESAKLNMISATLSIGVTLYLLKTFGFDGACWSIVARHTMTALWLAPLFVRTFPRVLTSLPLVRIGAATLLMKLLLNYSLAGAPAGGSLPPKLLLLHLTGWASVATLAYLGALALLKVIDLAEFFRLLQRKIPTAGRKKSVSHEDETAVITL